MLPQEDGRPSTLHPWWALNCSCQDWSNHQCLPSLIYVSTEDTEEPLTPSHLLCRSWLLSLPEHLTYRHPLGDEDFEIAPAQAARRVKHLNNVLNHFWRWSRQEYFLELRECQRYSWGKESASTIEVGDDVLLYDDALPRSFWKLARVLELITGRDGKPRGAVVKVPAKSGGTTTLRRSLQLLYPLEIRQNFQLYDMI